MQSTQVPSPDRSVELDRWWLAPRQAGGDDVNLPAAPVRSFGNVVVPADQDIAVQSEQADGWDYWNDAKVSY